MMNLHAHERPLDFGVYLSTTGIFYIEKFVDTILRKSQFFFNYSSLTSSPESMVWGGRPDLNR